MQDRCNAGGIARSDDARGGDRRPATPLRRLEEGRRAPGTGTCGDGPRARAIDLGAIERNAARLCAAAPRAAVCAVVKADAYGHGMVPAARAALAGGASWLAIATAREAQALRADGLARACSSSGR